METGSGSSNPILDEERKMKRLAEKVKQLEQELREAKILIDRLKDLISKCHSDCFPPEIKCESEKRY